MKCNVCQAINVDDARFCGHCGSVIVQPATPTAPGSPTELSAQAPPLEASDQVWTIPAESRPPDPLWAGTVPDRPGQAADGATWHPPPPDEHPTPFAGDGGLTTSVEAAAAGLAGSHQQAPTVVYVAEPAGAAFGVSAGLAARRRRQRVLLVACAIVAAAALGVVAVLAFGRDQESTASPGSGVESQLPATTVSVSVPVTSIPSVPASVTTAIAATPISLAPTTTAFAATTIPAATATTAATAATVVSATSSPPASTSVTTVVTTSVPATTPGSSASTAVATTTPPPTAGPGEGDLGLSTPISRPPCDGTYITLIGAAVDPARYAESVGTLLSRYPEASYLRTELVCSSLRARTADGTAIYVIYFGPFASRTQACAARADGPSDAYVKSLDNTSDPSGAVDC